MAVVATSSFADLTKKLRARAMDIKSRVESMHGKKIVVGIPAAATYPNGKKVAVVADLVSHGILDNGKKSSKPPRPFVQIACDENGKKWSRMLQDEIRKALRARKTPNLRPEMIKIGEEMQKDIRRTMLDLDVYDTGRMHNSISILQVNNDRILE